MKKRGWVKMTNEEWDEYWKRRRGVGWEEEDSGSGKQEEMFGLTEEKEEEK